MGSEMCIRDRRGPCRVADGAWCSHGLCASTPRAPRPKPGVAMLLEAAVEGLGGGARACNAACALATVLEAAGAPRLALRQWLALAEPPAACPRAQLRVALHHHSGIRGASELRVARPDRGSTARAHAAASAFGKVGANPHARPEEAALAGTYLGCARRPLHSPWRLPARAAMSACQARVAAALDARSPQLTRARARARHAWPRASRARAAASCISTRSACRNAIRRRAAALSRPRGWAALTLPRCSASWTRSAAGRHSRGRPRRPPRECDDSMSDGRVQSHAEV